MAFHFINTWFFFWPFGWILFFFILSLISRVLFGGRWHRYHYRGWDGYHQDDPLAIVKQRYAKGEITKEQYETIRKDLEK